MSDVLVMNRVISRFFSQIVEIRRYLHQHPELSGKEEQTATFICKCLDDLQIPYNKDVAGHGIVALLSGTRENGSGKTIALRADMDALPITEMTNVTYSSVNDGVMHACGHDVHMAALLGTLMVLNECKDLFSGNVKAIFQPSEEEYEGGAPFMIEAGVLENPDVDAIFGLHVSPELRSGTIGLHEGAFMASSDEIHLTVLGKGGHAALVDEIVNPIIIAAKVIEEIDCQVNRAKPGDVDMVLSFGRLLAEGSCNIIPDKAVIAGTFRTFSEEWRVKVLAMITDIATRTAREMGGTCEVNIRNGYPVLKNDPDVTRRVSGYASEWLGAQNVITIPKRMTAEDFSYYLQKLPGTFFRLGTQPPIGESRGALHSAYFDIDETALQTAVGVLSQVVLGELG